MRMSTRRFTQLANGFSEAMEQYVAMLFPRTP